jgi:organic radical activating enzyme
MDKFYCAAIDKGLHIDGTNAYGVRLRPCCNYIPTEVYSNYNEYEGSKEVKDLKQATDWPRGCSFCKHAEIKNHISPRQLANESLKDVEGIRYELFPSNVCNLKCLMCDPKLSTALAAEQHKLNIIDETYLKDYDQFSEMLEIVDTGPKADSISIIGGEFFLTKNNIEAMDYAIDNQLPLRVVTNATVLLNTHLEKLKQIPKLELQISCDGIESGYEFMRYPAKWDTFKNNSQELISTLKRQSININFVLQALNAMYLIPTLDYFNKLKTKVRITTLNQPHWLTFSILTASEKSALISLLDKQLGIYKLAKPQIELVNKLKTHLGVVMTDSDNRNYSIDRLSKTFRLRKLTKDAIQDQLGVYSELCEELTRPEVVGDKIIGL